MDRHASFKMSTHLNGHSPFKLSTYLNGSASLKVTIPFNDRPSALQTVDPLSNNAVGILPAARSNDRFLHSGLLRLTGD